MTMLRFNVRSILSISPKARSRFRSRSRSSPLVSIFSSNKSETLTPAATVGDGVSSFCAWFRNVLFEYNKGPCMLIVAKYSSSTYSEHKDSRFMQKLLNKKGGKTTKKRWYEPHFMEPLEFSGPRTKRGHSLKHLTRVRQHSYVMYDKITELINSGELCQDLLEMRVNITSVKVHNDMNGMNVYWDAERSDWEDVEKLLETRKGKLRSLLISYHVLGRIPAISFVKAKHFYSLTEVNHLLEVADYGPEYTSGQTPRQLQQHQTQQQHQHQEADDAKRKNNAITCTDEIHSQSQRDFSKGHPHSQGYMGYLSDQDQESRDDDKKENFLFSKGDGMTGAGNIVQRETSCSSSTVSSPNSKSSFDLHEHHNNNSSSDTKNSATIVSPPNLNFRDDLYGLKRGAMMKKILAKKRGIEIDSDYSENSAACQLNLNVPSYKSKKDFLKKLDVKNKTKKEENRMKQTLLDRDFSNDF